ncbi:putative molybdopterin biosynthesis protein MoeA/LysR substrate binding-domain-containing protein [uncultured Clostridium sp.]|uniref:helix-turn-helix transcriptional regulator n=1 Tax=uncultured Clostridium sp. TaxID=59620 RepID=UPI00082244E5|nr:helix-turn-helix transcriptional regulator [uncultured Clostridium sp.]SCJ63218.1 putative molybdopterin biosynthesis protein MoeA/LysR substrate binding-domain-containing protein [uncultured Clostridium sp.]
MNSKESLNAMEVAELLNITKNTVYELVKRGELPGYKVGKKLRIDKADVNQYIESQKTGYNNKAVRRVKEIVQVKSENVISSSKDIIIAGQDQILDILSEYIKANISDVRVLRNNVGSYTNLYDLYNDRISVCSSHLWDGDSNTYNYEYVRRLLPGIPCVLINLAYRMQGFYVAKGNPYNIKTWEDLINKNVSIINREKGSGTRILLDEKLRANNISSSNIKGYDIERNSHLSVASSIARGEGDVGMGIEKVALQVKGIDFIPIQEERYDLVIKKEDLNLDVYKTIVDIIESKEFKEEVDGLSGYDLRDIGKIIDYT